MLPSLRPPTYLDAQVEVVLAGLEEEQRVVLGHGLVHQVAEGRLEAAAPALQPQQVCTDTGHKTQTSFIRSFVRSFVCGLNHEPVCGKRDQAKDKKRRGYMIYSIMYI